MISPRRTSNGNGKIRNSKHLMNLNTSVSPNQSYAPLTGINPLLWKLTPQDTP